MMANVQQDCNLQGKNTSDYSSQGFTRNNSFTLYKPSPEGKKTLGGAKTKKFSIFKTQNPYMKKMNTSMANSTVPHASIDLMVNTDNQKMMIKQEQSNDDTVDNINSSTPNKPQENADDVNMDSVSESNYTLQSMMHQEPNINDIKQAAVRKFIDSENEENLYVMQDGSLVVECIKSSLIKRVSQTAELMLPLKSVMNVNEPHQGKVDYPQSQAQLDNRTVNVNLDHLQNYIAMLNYQNQSNAANLSQILAYLQQNNTNTG